MMCMEKQLLVKKMFTNKLNIFFPLQAWVQVERKHTDSPIKKVFRVEQLVKTSF